MMDTMLADCLAVQMAVKMIGLMDAGTVAPMADQLVVLEVVAENIALTTSAK
jgi:hypothetical protein